MLDRWQALSDRLGDRPVLKRLVVPSLLAVGCMAVAWALVAGLLILREPLVVGFTFTRVLALGVMFLSGHLLAGFWTGRRLGLQPIAAVGAGFTPVLVLILATAVFGGPVLTPFETPLLTLAGVLVWTISFGVGMVVGSGRPLRDDLSVGRSGD